MNPLLLLLLLGMAARQQQMPMTKGPMKQSPTSQGSRGVTQGHMGMLGPVAKDRKPPRVTFGGNPPRVPISGLGQGGRGPAPNPLVQLLAKSPSLGSSSIPRLSTRPIQ